MGNRLRVAVVQGGPSSEAEVSRASALAVEGALKPAHDVVRLELDEWLAESLRTGGYDVVFPAVHGPFGEDGCLQGLLEILALPYVGSGVLASALAMDKVAARRVFAEVGLPIAKGTAVKRGQSTPEDLRASIGKRLVVKPARSGSAIGVARIREGDPDDMLAKALEDAWALDETAVVEHFAVGREITCSVIDDGTGVRALAATEIESPKDAFYTYEARYASGRSVHTCPAKLEDEVRAKVHQAAVSAHVALGCRDLSRADFVVGDEGDPSKVTLLEVNTMPGFTATSLYPEAAAAYGIGFPALCDGFVRRAFSRGSTHRNRALPFPK
jgi:D-alanine-D-alanine ligase